MIPRINTYESKLTSKDSVAEKWLDVSVKYKILIQKIIFLLREDFIASVVLDKTLTTFPRGEKSLSVVVEFPIAYDFDKMILVTNEGDFLFCCDEQAKQEMDEHIDIKKLYG